MKTFPMFLRMHDRSVVIIGGGEQAAQKCRLLLKTEAEIIIAAEALDEELSALHHAGRISWYKGAINAALLQDRALVFCATGCRGTDAALHGVAKAAGATVNVVDAPELCDAITPSIVDRDPVVVAIGTEGTAPVLARQVKTRIEEQLEPNLGLLAALAGRMRGAVAMRVQRDRRREFWRWVFAGEPRRAHALGQEAQAAAIIQKAVEAGAAPSQPASGSISIIGAGGDKDLLTLRAVQRLQEADVIFVEAGVADGVLEYARRDAERIHLDEGLASDVREHILDQASEGNRAVYLVRTNPEHALGHSFSAEGILTEIVPGISGGAQA